MRKKVAILCSNILNVICLMIQNVTRKISNKIHLPDSLLSLSVLLLSDIFHAMENRLKFKLKLFQNIHRFYQRLIQNKVIVQ